MKSKRPIIDLSNAFKEYKIGDIVTPVLRGISLKLFPGDFIAIIGPSGSGKSTLMNIIGLLDTLTSGKYIINSSDVTRLSEDEIAFIRNREVGFVFQSFNLLPRASALDNVILPAVYAGVTESERRVRAVKLLAKLGIGDKLRNKPSELSGGQQQRVAIARALMNNPKIILADEPTGNLDTKSGKEVMAILEELNEQGKTIILITHEQDIAKRAKKIINLKDGRIV